MGVIVESRLISQRLRALERQRARCRPPAGALPGWAIDALCSAGMTRAEVIGAGIVRADVDASVRLEQAIDDMEDELLRCNVEGVDGLIALAEAALQRLRRPQADAGGAAFADRADRRALALVERLLDQLHRLHEVPLRQVG